MGWIHIPLGRRTIFGTYLSHYVLIIFLAPKNAWIRQEDIVIFAGHQRGALRPLGPTIYPQEAGSKHWVCLIFHPSVTLEKKYISKHTSTYLSNDHLTYQTPVLSYQPGHSPITQCFPLHLQPIHQFLTNVYNVTRRSLSRPRCPQNNTGNLFPCKLITVANFSTFLTDE